MAVPHDESEEQVGHMGRSRGVEKGPTDFHTPLKQREDEGRGWEGMGGDAMG